MKEKSAGPSRRAETSDEEEEFVPALEKLGREILGELREMRTEMAELRLDLGALIHQCHLEKNWAKRTCQAAQDIHEDLEIAMGIDIYESESEQESDTDSELELELEDGEVEELKKEIEENKKETVIESESEELEETLRE